MSRGVKFEGNSGTFSKIIGGGQKFPVAINVIGFNTFGPAISS